MEKIPTKTKWLPGRISTHDTLDGDVIVDEPISDECDA